MSDNGGPPPEDVNALLRRIDGTWRQLLEVLRGIPEERMEEAGASGEWSAKHLFGHIAFWDERAVHDIERTLAGQPEEAIDWQALNDADHAARMGRTLPEERAAMYQAHADLVDRLEGVAGIDAAKLDRAIRGDTYEHYAEHVQDLREWLARTAS